MALGINCKGVVSQKIFFLMPLMSAQRLTGFPAYITLQYCLQGEDRQQQVITSVLPQKNR